MHFRSLAVISLGGLLIYFTLINSQLALPSGNNCWNLPLPYSSALLYMLLLMSYLIFYYSVIIKSPSQQVLLLLEKHKTLTYEEIVVHFTDEELILPRLKDLCICGYARYKENTYYLTFRGKQVARILDIFQIILGRNVGG